MAPRIGIRADGLDDAGDLIDVAAAWSRPGAPLVAVDGAQIPIPVGPLVPDAHSVFIQVGDVGVTRQKPEELMDHRPEMQLLGGEQREDVGQIDAHLISEDAPGSGAGAVALLDSVFENVVEQIQVNLHGPDGS